MNTKQRKRLAHKYMVYCIAYGNRGLGAIDPLAAHKIWLEYAALDMGVPRDTYAEDYLEPKHVQHVLPAYALSMVMDGSSRVYTVHTCRRCGATIYEGISIYCNACWNELERLTNFLLD